MFPSIGAVGNLNKLNVGDKVLVLEQPFKLGKCCPERSVVIQNLGDLFVGNFVRGKYARLDCRVFQFLLGRERNDIVINPKRRSAVAWLHHLAWSQHVAINGHSQLGCEFVEE